MLVGLGRYPVCLAELLLDGLLPQQVSDSLMNYMGLLLAALLLVDQVLIVGQQAQRQSSIF